MKQNKLAKPFIVQNTVLDLSFTSINETNLNNWAKLDVSNTEQILNLGIDLFTYERNYSFLFEIPRKLKNEK